MNTLRTLIFAVLGLSLNVAIASPIIIDFSGQPDDVVSELTYEEMGISLTISAWTTSYNSDQDQLEPWTLVDNGFGVSVRDNGIGFNSNHQKHQKGLGMKNIESRIQLLKGKFTIQSKINHGFKIKITI